LKRINVCIKIHPKSTQINRKLHTSWFDTPYYHILYKVEITGSSVFMDNLTHYLNLTSKVLDLACGKGRHSIYLNQLGFTVLGADLSENSIAEANKNANENYNSKFMTCVLNL
jgi:2-polyprenyl-3-methyl-5-hydroxy-6-metoxy-1,4-benzoquinol methylase